MAHGLGLHSGIYHRQRWHSPWLERWPCPIGHHPGVYLVRLPFQPGQAEDAKDPRATFLEGGSAST